MIHRFIATCFVLRNKYSKYSVLVSYSYFVISYLFRYWFRTCFVYIYIYIYIYIFGFRLFSYMYIYIHARLSRGGSRIFNGGWTYQSGHQTIRKITSNCPLFAPKSCKLGTGDELESATAQTSATQLSARNGLHYYLNLHTVNGTV